MQSPMKLCVHVEGSRSLSRALRVASKELNDTIIIVSFGYIEVRWTQCTLRQDEIKCNVYERMRIECKLRVRISL